MKTLGACVGSVNGASETSMPVLTPSLAVTRIRPAWSLPARAAVATVYVVVKWFVTSVVQLSPRSGLYWIV